jgi:hypothetical protein
MGKLRNTTHALPLRHTRASPRPWPRAQSPAPRRTILLQGRDVIFDVTELRLPAGPRDVSHLPDGEVGHRGLHFLDLAVAPKEQRLDERPQGTCCWRARVLRIVWLLSLSSARWSGVFSARRAPVAAHGGALLLAQWPSARFQARPAAARHGASCTFARRHDECGLRREVGA